MNFVTDVVERLPTDRVALIERGRDRSPRNWSFGEISAHSAALAATFVANGVRRGDVVVTMIGNRSEWVLAMLACFRIGAVVLPLNEQLRAHDIEHRLLVTGPQLVVADERNHEQLAQALALVASALEPVVLTVPDRTLHDPGRVGLSVPPAADLSADDSCLITFTSGTSGRPKAVLHCQRYLFGQAKQAQYWLAPQAEEIVWCTAASGWSKSARNVFVAPWLRGATALIHDARFDPHERLEIIERERVAVLCMAPTEYRVMAKKVELRPLPALRGLLAAGEALNPEVLDLWQQTVGLPIRDGYGQTETGQLTGAPRGQQPRAGSMGRQLPGIKMWIEEGELVVDPRTVPTFFCGYLGQEPTAATLPWRTGDRVRRSDDGWFYFEGRNDDVIISSGYRIGPFEVESALVAHPAVTEAAVVAAADSERGSIVHAVVVLRDGEIGNAALTTELQEHVKAITAPYKYPRQIDYVAELPKTASGKVRRALLREQLK